MGEKRKVLRGKQWGSLIAGVLVIGFVGIILTKSHAPKLVKDEEIPMKYLTIIDAGSSGCRAHVFKYKTVQGQVQVEAEHPNLKVRPGLSSFANDPQKAGDSIKGLLDFMREHIPVAERSSAPVYLKATAGLRMLPIQKSSAILDSVKKIFRESEFAFDDDHGAIIIQGTDEGGFGWLSVNFLFKKLKKQDTLTVVEMGGASAQVTSLHAVAPKKKNLRGSKLPDGYEFNLKLDGNSYSLYAKSYLGYGLEQAREKVSTYLLESKAQTDPCLPKGFSPKKNSDNVYDGVLPGSGDVNKCQKIILDALFPPSSACTFDFCSGIQAAFQPKSLPEKPVLAFENFFYTQQMLGLDVKVPNDFAQAAPLVCDATWAELEASDFPKDGSQKSDLTKICFSALYLPTFLTKGLGFPSDKPLRIQQSVGNFGIDWSLGAAIREANLLAHHHQ